MTTQGDNEMTLLTKPMNSDRGQATNEDAAEAEEIERQVVPALDERCRSSSTSRAPIHLSCNELLRCCTWWCRECSPALSALWLQLRTATRRWRSSNVGPSTLSLIRITLITACAVRDSRTIFVLAISLTFLARLIVRFITSSFAFNRAMCRCCFFGSRVQRAMRRICPSKVSKPLTFRLAAPTTSSRV
jgi:hypothetical protein